MGFARWGRVVAVLQWFLSVIMPFFAVFGRVLFTGEIGWLGALGLFFSPAVAGLLLVPPLVTLFDREARRQRSLRVAYVWATVTVWGALFVMALTAPDSGDLRPYPSVLQLLTGVGSDVTMAVTVVLGVLAASGWLLALGFAIAGVVRNRRTDAHFVSRSHLDAQSPNS